MSPALSDLPLRKVVDALGRAGFAHVRTKGSHAVYQHPNGRVAVVPQHPTVKRGTLVLHRVSSSGVEAKRWGR